jgi:predicted MFS family arabinose efflux permease
MLKLELFAHRNFAIGNLETLSMYAGLGIFFFYLTIYVQQVAGYTALQAGLATLPETLVMFALSRRFGALADRFGPRIFMAAGPLVAAAGCSPSSGWARTSRTSPSFYPECSCSRSG